MSLPSKKYQNQLLPIKQRLMRNIAEYFENGKFELTGETIIHYLQPFGTFNACFDIISGNEFGLKLYLKAQDYRTVIGFEANELTDVENEIPFLIRLLDYIDMDYRETHNGKRPNQKKH